jgi:hypothetical protein
VLTWRKTFTEAQKFSVMTLDGKMFYFTTTVTIRQSLEVLLLLVTETLKNNASLNTDIFHFSCYVERDGKGIREKGASEIKVQKI